MLYKSMAQIDETQIDPSMGSRRENRQTRSAGLSQYIYDGGENVGRAGNCIKSNNGCISLGLHQKQPRFDSQICKSITKIKTLMQNQPEYE
jgi:hypothetical protein